MGKSTKRLRTLSFATRAALRQKLDRDMDSDQEDEEDAYGQHGQVGGVGNGFNRTADEKAVERWGNGSGVEESELSCDTESDDDGFQGGKIRGDAYESLKSR